MITLFIYGLDQFVVGDISKNITSNLAKVYETDDDNINFVAVNNMVFHDGMEQTSWHTIINVKAPEQCHILQDKVKKILIEAFKPFTINIEIYFDYYHLHHRQLVINEDYPRYMSNKNSIEIDSDYEDVDDSEIYTEDVFRDFEERLNKK